MKEWCLRWSEDRQEWDCYKLNYNGDFYIYWGTAFSKWTWPCR